MSPLDFLAQQITAGKILNALNPGGNIWAWMCYIVIVMNLAALFLQKQGTMQLTIFIAVSTLAALINILGQSGVLKDTGSGIMNDVLQSERIRFGNWVVSILMFVFPLVFAGMTKTGRSRLPAILAAIFAAMFLFGRWIVIILPST
jgi:hypothetical protein